MSGATARTATILAAILALGGLPGPDAGTYPAALPSVERASAQEEPAAEPTTVVVRAVAHDAKVIGSNVGGARITIRDAESGEVLARGLQEGGTGSTERIVRRPHRRGAEVYAAGDAAAYEATLSLRRPTRVEVVAEGPLGTSHATQRASRTMLLVPGGDVTGEGVILELHGFTVELGRPDADRSPAAREVIPIRATVTMLCGCPLEPGGLWDADRVEVTARLTREGRLVREATLDYAGRTSTFEGRIRAPEPGTYRLTVVAADAERANFGRVRREIRVRGEGP